MTCGPGSPRTPRPPWSPGSRRCAPAPATSRAMPSASRCASWDGARCSWTASSSAWTSSSSPWSPPAPPACSPCTGSALTPRRCCSSRPGTTPGGSAPRRPGRTCARPPRSRHRRGKSPGTGPSPGGDRQPNHALWRIVFTRMGSDAATRAYAERRTEEGKSKAEIIRCVKRYVARQVYPHLRPDAGGRLYPGDGLTRYSAAANLLAVERAVRSEEHTSELQSHVNLVCRLLLEKKKKNLLPSFSLKKKKKKKIEK